MVSLCWCTLSHKVFQDKCHKCVIRVPIIEESRDGPSNTNTVCHHRNKKQAAAITTYGVKLCRNCSYTM